MDLSKLIADATGSTGSTEQPNSVHTVNEAGLKADPNFTTSTVEEVMESLDNHELEEDEVDVVQQAEVDIEEMLLENEATAETTPDATTDENCAHLCDCSKWWSHGLKQKCRFPDLVKQGLCPECLDSGAAVSGTYTLEDDFKESDKGDRKLSPKAQVIIRNGESLRVKDMTVEQLTYHMTHIAFEIEELRVRALQSRHRRTELEEEEIANIPESERKAFIEALRAGKPKKEKKAPKTPKLSKAAEAEQREKTLVATIQAQGKSLQDAKVIASLMLRTGKSQAQVEALLND